MVRCVIEDKLPYRTIDALLEFIKSLIVADFRINVIEGFLYWRILNEFIMNFLYNQQNIELSDDTYNEIAMRLGELEVYNVTSQQYVDFKTYIKKINKSVYALLDLFENILQLPQCQKEIDALKKRGEAPLTMLILVKQNIFRNSANGCMSESKLRELENLLYWHVIRNLLNNIKAKSNKKANKKHEISDNDIDCLEKYILTYEENSVTSYEYEKFKQYAVEINPNFRQIIDDFETFVELNKCKEVIDEDRGIEKPSTLLDSVEELLLDSKVCGLFHEDGILITEQFMYKTFISNIIEKISDDHFADELLLMGINQSDAIKFTKKVNDYDYSCASANDYAYFKASACAVSHNIVNFINKFEDIAKLSNCKKVIETARNSIRNGIDISTNITHGDGVDFEVTFSHKTK